MNTDSPMLLAAATVEGTTGLAQDIRVGKHQLTADEPVTNGGADSGPTPYQMLVSALGACTAITLKMYAQRKGWDLGALSVKLKLFRDGEVERVERVLFASPDLTAEQRERLLQIAGKTPVTKTLLRSLRIDTEFAP